MTRNAGIVTVAVVMLFLAGCSAEHYYNEGNKALTRGQYDKAIDNFQKAAGKEPDNAQYREAVESARKQAAEHYVREASRLANANDLGGAEGSAQRALRYDPSNRLAGELLNDIRQRAAAAEAKRNEALRLAREGLFDQAIVAMQQAMAANSSLPGGQRDMDSIRRLAADHWVTQARGWLARDQWNQAEDAARQALAYSPNHPDARRVLEEVANRRKAEQLVAQAKADMAQNRFESALAALEQAARLHPGRADVPALMQTCRQSLAVRYLAQGRQLAAREDYIGAINLYRQAQAVLPGYGNVDALIAEAQANIAGRYQRAADRAYAAGLWGNALVHYLLADLIAPGTGPQRVIDDCARRIRGRLELRLGAAVGADRRQFDFRDLIGLMEPAVIRHLAAVKPDFLTVLTQAQMQRLLANHNMLPGDLFGQGEQVAARRLNEITIIVQVRIMALDIKTNRTQTDGVVRIQTGVQRFDNPDWPVAVANRNEAARQVNQVGNLAAWRAREGDVMARPPSPARNRQLRDVRAEIARLQNALAAAQANLDAAERTLAATPRRIDRPVFADHHFPILDYTKTAVLTATVRSVDTATGKPFDTRNVTGTAVAVDRSVQPDPARNVPGDPLQLPTDAEMSRQVAQRTIGLVLGAVEAMAYRLPGRHLAAAQAALAASQTEAAVEHYFDFLFAVPVSNEATEKAFTEMIALVPNEREAANLHAALVTRCGLLRPPVRLPIQADERDDVVLLTRILAPRPRADVQLPGQIVAVDGRAIFTLAALDAIVNRFRPGDNVAVDVNDRGRVVRMQLPVGPAGP